MKFKLDAGVVKIVETIGAAGHEAWIVGGAVRDLLLDLPSYDWDVTTDATPELRAPSLTKAFMTMNMAQSK